MSVISLRGFKFRRECYFGYQLFFLFPIAIGCGELRLSLGGEGPGSFSRLCLLSDRITVVLYYCLIRYLSVYCKLVRY